MVSDICKRCPYVFLLVYAGLNHWRHEFCANYDNSPSSASLKRNLPFRKLPFWVSWKVDISWVPPLRAPPLRGCCCDTVGSSHILSPKTLGNDEKWVPKPCLHETVDGRCPLPNGIATEKKSIIMVSTCVYSIYHINWCRILTQREYHHTMPF